MLLDLGSDVTHLNLIAGTWQAGTCEIENRNPSDLSDLIGLFAQAGRDQLDLTLEVARSAQAEWATYGLERKQSVLMKIGTELIARAEELGRLLSREEGKPLAGLEVTQIKELTQLAAQIAASRQKTARG